MTRARDKPRLERRALRVIKDSRIIRHLETPEFLVRTVRSACNFFVISSIRLLGLLPRHHFYFVRD